MPINLTYQELSKNKFQLETEVKISGYNCKIQVPAKLAKQIKNKKIKVIIEVID